jgi:hypothetical protein
VQALEKGSVVVSEEAQKRLITILASALSSVMANRLSERLIDVPEERGVKDDIKEALLKAGFTISATLIASVVVRNVVNKRWGS